MTNWYRVGRDMLARDIWTEVPLDWNEPDGEQIRIFAREFADPARLQAGLDDVPAIVYLQGGPGGKGVGHSPATRFHGRAQTLSCCAARSARHGAFDPCLRKRIREARR